jgi:hypothetical protein
MMRQADGHSITPRYTNLLRPLLATADEVIE